MATKNLLTLKKKKSIVDVAKELNVSTATLSFVLNGRGREKRISEELIKRIEEYIEATGYKPNFFGKSLRTGKSQTICMIVEDIADPFFSEVASGIEKKAFEAGYKLVVSSCNNEPEKIKDVITLMYDRNVDGFIIAPTTQIEDVIIKLQEEGKPLILFDRYLPEINTFNVIVDNEYGSYKAIEHLFDNGFKNIAFITLESEQTQMLSRLKGYNKFVEENGLKSHILHIKYELQYEQITRKIKTFLKDNPEVDAILFGTNYLTVGGIKALKQLGSTGNKIGYVSFDDHLFYELFTPTITAVSQPIDLLSSTIINNMLEMLDTTKKTQKKKETIILPVSLIIRQSSIPK